MKLKSNKIGTTLNFFDTKSYLVSIDLRIPFHIKQCELNHYLLNCSALCNPIVVYNIKDFYQTWKLCNQCICDSKMQRDQLVCK